MQGAPAASASASALHTDAYSRIQTHKLVAYAVIQSTCAYVLVKTFYVRNELLDSRARETPES